MGRSETYSGTLTRQRTFLLEVGGAGRALVSVSLTECPYAVVYLSDIA